MEANSFIIPVPNALGLGVSAIERFYKPVVLAPAAHSYLLNMSAVTWIQPHGAIALVLAARLLAQRSGRPVQLQRLREDVHLYLKRMDILDNHHGWLSSTEALGEEWFRNPQTPNLLELTPVAGPKDVEMVITRAERVFERWLTRTELYSLLTVLSEVCANIYQHSGDHQGCVLIQTYRNLTQGVRTVCLAVGDLGCGIQKSIVGRHGEIGAEPFDYLRAAIRGRTSRITGRGGLGLRRIRQIACEYGGYVWLRSDTASLFSRTLNSMTPARNLTAIPGTQLAVELKTALSS